MQTLIINKRHEMPRAKRWLWDGITILLWVGFFYLWKPVFHIFYRIITADVKDDEISWWIYDNIHSVTFSNGIFMMIATPTLLFILSRLNRHLAPSEHLIYSTSDYAEHFNLEETQLKKTIEEQVITLYFDDAGQIIQLEKLTL